MNQLWKIQVLEPRRTDNSALVKATYRGGDSFYEFKSVVTLTPEGRKQFAELCNQRLEAHLKSIATVDKDLVKELEDEMNGEPFAIDVMNKKKAEVEQKENDRKGKIEDELDKKRKELESKSADGDDAPAKPSYADESAPDAPADADKDSGSETPAPENKADKTGSDAPADAKKATSGGSKFTTTKSNKK